MKSILLITESGTLREYLASKLQSYTLPIITGANGLDGMLRLRANVTEIDLIVMDYSLTRMSSMEFLVEKQRNPNASDIPVIILASKIEKPEIMALSKMNVKKICSKPIMIDSFLKAVSDIIGHTLEIDATPCVIDTHVNEDILFIEIAHGLNHEKIELLRFKLKELSALYEKRIAGVLIVMSSLVLSDGDTPKLGAILSAATEETGINPKNVKVLSNSRFTRSFVASSLIFGKVEVFNNLEKALDSLTGLKVSSFVKEGKSIVKEDFLVSKGSMAGESLHMKFQKEGPPSEAPVKVSRIAIVEDDLVARALVWNALSSGPYETKQYENGREFLDDLENNEFDLVFLDLMMPEVDGFGVLEAMKERKASIPVVILSALSKKETVMQAIKFGIHSYIVKPVEPVRITKKAEEILHTIF